MIAELTKAESLSLKAHEGVIERGLNTFIEVGNALFAIREERLYRDSHKTFEAYCRERWGMSKTHANCLISSSEVAKDLTAIAVKPATESQCRELAKVPKEQRAEVWQEVVNTAPNGRVTAKHVAEVVAKHVAEVVAKHATEAVERTSSKGMRITYDGLDRARNAIVILQGILPTDPRRREALEYVKNWIDANP
jgi:hypothetical protein